MEIPNAPCHVHKTVSDINAHIMAPQLLQVGRRFKMVECGNANVCLRRSDPCCTSAFSAWVIPSCSDVVACFARCAHDSDGKCSPEAFHLLLQLCVLCLGDAQLLCQAGAALLKPAVILPALQLFLELLPQNPDLNLIGAMARLNSFYTAGMTSRHMAECSSQRGLLEGF